MNTRFVRSSRWFRLTAIIALCLLALAGTTSFALNRSGHGQKDPSPIAYEEDEDPVPEGVAALMDTAKSLHGTIDTITYEQSYEGTTYTKQAYVYVPASYASNKPTNVLYLTHGWWGNAAGLASGVAPVVDELETAGKAAPTQVVFDLVADRVHGVAFSLVDPQLQAVLGHKVGIVLAELIDLRRHVPQGGIL